MKLIVETEDEALKEYLKSDSFQELAILLDSETPSLRQIKTVFGQGIEKKLDLLIQHKIVERRDRRYSLTIPQALRDSALVEEWVNRILASMRQENLNEAYGLLYLLASQRKQKGIYWIDANQTLLYFRTVTNGELTIASLSLAEWENTIPSYFDYLRTGEQGKFEAMQAILGDVDPVYYLDQIQVVLEKIVEGRRRIRPTIFVESLLAFGIIREGESFEIVAPVLATLPANDFLPAFSKLADIDRRIILAEVLKAFGTQTVTLLIKTASV